MQIAIPLDQMSVADKLRTIEEIWNSLQSTPDMVPPPTWHADILDSRERQVQDGELQFRDWSEEKRRIMERIR